MKTKASMIIVICSLVLSNFAQASAGWSDYVTVAELVPTARHYYEVRLPVRENPSGCKNKTWFYQDYASMGSDKIFDFFLEGIKSGIRLRVYVTGICNIKGYSEISSISVIP
ncbi:MAG: hypothetical protein ACI9KN_000765 [Gammaproteobacteria bacterium]|jgi:hypothetical protein